MLHLWFEVGFNWTWTFKMRHIFRLLDLWLQYVTFDLMDLWRNPCCTYGPSLVAIGPELSKWDTFPGYLTFDLSMWPLTSWTCEGTNVAHMTQVWLPAIGSELSKWDTFTGYLTFDLSMWPHEHLKEHMLHMWPQFGCNWTWTVKMRHIFRLLYLWTHIDFWLINIWRYPCCTYDPSLVVA